MNISSRETQRMTAIILNLPVQNHEIILDTEKLIEMWLHGKSPHTCDAYRRDIKHFFDLVGHKLLTDITIANVQHFATHLAQKQYAIETQRRRLGSIKSLLSYCHDLGVLKMNVGRFVKPPKAKDTLAERLLTEEQVQKLLNASTNQRDYILLRLLYATGARISEICSLRWQDLRDASNQRGQITLFGKGRKTRVVVISTDTWAIVKQFQRDAKPTDFVFRSRTGRMLQRGQVQRIITALCERAGLSQKVSPHWFRHAHATHALENGCPLVLLQQTLGHAHIATTGRYLHVRPQDSSALYLPV